MTKEEKIIRIMELLPDIDDYLVHRFFDVDSDELLDEKIDALTKLKNGVPPCDIPDYYSILELYPAEDEIWD